MADVSVPEIMQELRYRIGRQRTGQDKGGRGRSGQEKLHFMIFALRVSLRALHIYDGEGTGRKSETGFRIIPS